MKTKEVLSYGIDRNFLRQCEHKGLIDPPRIDHEDIIDKDYTRREYSYKDVEIVWNAYLCRQMGFSFEEIQKLNNGESLSLRNSMQKMIEDKEREIEELQAVVKFMRLVKAVGVMYPLAYNQNNSKSLADHINSCLDEADKHKALSTTVQLCDLLNAEEYTDEIDDQFNQILDNSDIYSSEEYKELKQRFIDEMMLIIEHSNLQPGDDEIQNHIHKIAEIQNQIDKLGGSKVTVKSSAIGILLTLIRDGDYRTFFLNLLGEEFVSYLIEALRIYLDIDDIAKINSFFILT